MKNEQRTIVMKTAEQWIQELNLSPHPEGGYYAEIEKSNQTHLSKGKERPLYTSIYFLLTDENPSHFHQLTSDESWYFHAGSPLTVHSLMEDGSYKQTIVGLESGQYLQHTVPAGTIFGSTVNEGYALVSCTVIPGFDFEDFRLYTKAELLKQYPEHKEIITKLAYSC